ncbi:MAG TPA: hypothetical protein VE863_12990 [Pyrinomonadaceae bacterium]|jgi:hypothetical protein|nr:hypothetical protein [Pyrinomonadaceae bacterium]
MATKIIDMVYAKKASLIKDKTEAGKNGTLAIAAMKGGMGSPAWRTYMMQFVEQSSPGIAVDQRQLDRLMGDDETKFNAEMDQKRAYLVGNAPCMDQTPTGFEFGILSIDEGIAAECDAETRNPQARVSRYAKKSGKAKKTAKKSGAKDK